MFPSWAENMASHTLQHCPKSSFLKSNDVKLAFRNEDGKCHSAPSITISICV
jgi:hypothetical protein